MATTIADKDKVNRDDVEALRKQQPQRYQRLVDEIIARILSAEAIDRAELRNIVEGKA